ncbi:MAG: methyltransferase domain-containing protein [Phycisphaerales bacterium]|nr:MAG: methyltransferase domain-containing protein [Phycisphaerales bacterium]
MPMTQQDIRQHYERDWKAKSDAAGDAEALRYSSEIEDMVMYGAYEQLIADLNMKANGGRILDVGSGAGRWVRFFLDRYEPRFLMGIDFAASSIELLNRWHPTTADVELDFRQADITEPGVELGGPFDLINVANVLFHIPENDLYARAVGNLARLVSQHGYIVTTEFLPRTTMRTQWMLVRSRYEFEAVVNLAGLRIVDVRAFSFFANDPMGLDGPDDGVRALFNKVQAGIRSVFESNPNEQTRRFFVGFLTDIERAALAFARERIADQDLPSQKLVVLKRG